MQEQWKPIEGYENYEVSNLGQVKNLKGHEKILKPLKKKDGYSFVVLWKNGKRKDFQIHRLVAQAFIPNPNNKPCVNHLDCNPSNNCVDNLEWVTHKENTQYALKLGRMKSAENLKNISAEQCRINGRKNSIPLIAINLTTGEQAYFNSQHEAAKELNLSDGNINNVLKGRLKKTGNYTFKYAEDPN